VAVFFGWVAGMQMPNNLLKHRSGQRRPPLDSLALAA